MEILVNKVFSPFQEVTETERGKPVVFTNDFFTVYQNANGEMEISLNEISKLLFPFIGLL